MFPARGGSRIEHMRHHHFGTIGREVSIIGQGTWQIESGDRKRAVAALQRGIELGMTHIDTAEMYGSGQSEQIVSAAIAGHRDDVFIVSKVLPQHASRAGTIKACEQSLRHLKTDYLDCYLLHWRGRYPLQETVAGFEALKHDGKIRSWGVSNFDVDDLEEAASIAGAENIACNQVLYHLRAREVENRVLPWCEERKVALVGYSPYAHSQSVPTSARDRKVLEQIAAAHDATPRQVVLSFLTRRPSLFTIPKASSVDHAEENAGAGGLKLTEPEIRHIDQAFPLNPSQSRLPIL
jgi:diketogulonate reductase-like aldo/keto reductase